MISREILPTFPLCPGVYLMKDRLGRVIYVGKAKSLKKRVSSYFTPSRAFAAKRSSAPASAVAWTKMTVHGRASLCGRTHTLGRFKAMEKR